MDAMSQMNSATQSMQQTSQAVQQIANSFPSDNKALTNSDVCTIQTDCTGAYIVVLIGVVIALCMLFHWTPFHVWYATWRDKKKNRK